MKCHKCGTEHEQQSKEDWWLCNCGSYHKGFPYECKLRKINQIRDMELMKLKKELNYNGENNYDEQDWCSLCIEIIEVLDGKEKN